MRSFDRVVYLSKEIVFNTLLCIAVWMENALLVRIHIPGQDGLASNFPGPRFDPYR
jgi:hypothetical protein